ncbi:MAG: VOC family protein [Phycisphaerae bacterium]|nr:VOC family protein [Phycisphaerae bacterium]
MSNATKKSPTSSEATRVMGAICWNELHTSDPKRASEFYAKVVGWSPKACGPAEGSNYTEWETASGKRHGGMMAVESGAAAPPHWAVYMNVADVDATAAKAVKLGGRIVSAPKDCDHVGRLCTIADPTGAEFRVIAGKGDCGARAPQDEPGSFCWAEILTNDVDATKRFYCDLLGWTSNTMPMPKGDYTLLWAAGADPSKKLGCVGGLMKILPEMGPMRPCWLSYIMVQDVDAAAKRATANGGRVCCPPTDIPNVGRFAVVLDPQNAVFALFTSKS